MACMVLTFLRTWFDGDIPTVLLGYLSSITGCNKEFSVKSKLKWQKQKQRKKLQSLPK